MIGHRQRVVRAVELHQRDDLVRLHRPLQRQQAAHGELGDRAGALVAEDRDAVDLRDVDGVARRVLGDVARRGHEPVAAAQRRHRRAHARGGEELERRQHAAVDLAGADVVAAAGVELDARVGEHVLDERLLAHQQDLADRGLLGVGAEERVLARRAVDRRRLEQLPAVEDRLRVDARGAAAGRADLEQDVRRLACSRSCRCGRGSCRRRPRARAQALDADVLAVEAEDLREVALEARVAVDLAGALELLLACRRRARRWAARVGEQPLLGGGRRLRRRAWRPTCGALAASVLATARAWSPSRWWRRRARSARRPWPAARAPWRPAWRSSCAGAEPGRSSRPSPGARTCRCCRRRPGAGRSGQGAWSGRRGRSGRR